MKKFPIELTVFSKTGGPLTKRIGSRLMARWLRRLGLPNGAGYARRAGVASMAEFGDLISGLKPYRGDRAGPATARSTRPVEVTTKAKLNGGAGIIARTGADVVFRQAEHALVLFDHDRKGMPATVAATLRRHGGFWPALVTVLPALADVARSSGPRLRPGYITARPGSSWRAPRARTFTSWRATAPTGTGFCGRCTSAAGWPGWAGTCSAPPGNYWTARSSIAWWAGRSGSCSRAARCWTRRCGSTASAASRWRPLVRRSIPWRPVRRSPSPSLPGCKSSRPRRRMRWMAIACAPSAPLSVGAGQGAGGAHRNFRERGEADGRAPDRGRAVAGYRAAVRRYGIRGLHGRRRAGRSGPVRGRDAGRSARRGRNTAAASPRSCVARMARCGSIRSRTAGRSTSCKLRCRRRPSPWRGRQGGRGGRQGLYRPDNASADLDGDECERLRVCAAEKSGLGLRAFNAALKAAKAKIAAQQSQERRERQTGGTARPASAHRQST